MARTRAFHCDPNDHPATPSLHADVGVGAPVAGARGQSSSFRSWNRHARALWSAGTARTRPPGMLLARTSWKFSTKSFAIRPSNGAFRDGAKRLSIKLPGTSWSGLGNALFARNPSLHVGRRTEGMSRRASLPALAGVGLGFPVVVQWGGKRSSHAPGSAPIAPAWDLPAGVTTRTCAAGSEYPPPK